MTSIVAFRLNPLRAFAIASRHHSFTAAAKHMGVTQVAISRQIAILESYLGVALFERGARSVKLTETGRTFSQEITPLFDELERVTTRVLADEKDTSINLRVHPAFAHHWLIPRMPDFDAAHPKTKIRLETQIEPTDFTETRLDAAVALGNGDWPGASSRKLFDDVVDVVCHPDYAAKFDDLEKAIKLGEAMLIRTRFSRSDWQSWADAAGIEIDPTSGQEFETPFLAYSAALHGFGLAIGQLTLLQDELSAGRLVRPFNRPLDTGTAFHVVWPRDRSVSEQSRIFIDWLLKAAGHPAEFVLASTS